MVHPSNPRLMNRVLEAVVHLCEGKGSTARNVLDFLRQSSKSSPRNLTMQVHRALKHAVNAGLLRHRSGRYKALFTLNPAPVKQPVVNETNDEKLGDGTVAFDAQQPTARVTSDGKRENRGKHKRSHHERKRKRSRSLQRRRRRRSESRRRDDLSEYVGEIRKLKYKEKGERDRSPRYRNTNNNRMKADIGDASTSSSHRKRSKGKSRDREYYSDLSDNSDYEDKNDRGRRRSPARQESKYDGSGKSGRRSVSQNRSPQRQQSQSRDDVKNKTDSDDHQNVDQNDEPDQDVDEVHEPNNSGSGSTL
ncbi:uncharacterized protein LOC143367311 [Andrena cerasifolii]|uniref:uncharacterized protein LOC143367311 n=1 Tax=Andrena cerasifolii TaxID=2819439 RepID=UPI004037AF15